MSLRANPIEEGLSVATVAELSRLPTGDLIDGEIAFVRTTLQYWTLQKGATTTLSSTVVGSGNSGNPPGTLAGRWVLFATVSATGAPSFGHAIKAAQAAVGAPADITWSAPAGTIAQSGVTGFSLLGGLTYYLQSALEASTFSDVNGFLRYQWVDDTNVAVGNNQTGVIIRADAAVLNSSAQPVASALFRPTVDTIVKVRVISAAGTATVEGGWARIEQYPS